MTLGSGQSSVQRPFLRYAVEAGWTYLPPGRGVAPASRRRHQSGAGRGACGPVAAPEPGEDDACLLQIHPGSRAPHPAQGDVGVVFSPGTFQAAHLRKGTSPCNFLLGHDNHPFHKFVTMLRFG